MATKDIYLAGATFWGGKAFIDRLPGVVETDLGISDEDAATVVQTFVLVYPDAESLGTTECMKVVYDPDIIPLPTLLEAFFTTIDPTSTEKQINYVSGMPQAKVFYTDPADVAVIDEAIAKLQSTMPKAVTIAVEPLKDFAPIGQYADDYIKRNFGEDKIVDPASADEFVAAHPEVFNK